MALKHSFYPAHNYSKLDSYESYKKYNYDYRSYHPFSTFSFSTFDKTELNIINKLNLSKNDLFHIKMVRAIFNGTIVDNNKA